ncbi:pirin domain-containing protein [Polyporus arcularius HHB13444]|uniref:Pirin domain-containing protein n=1 Tax=Polyporus arcularius HHB13444 TaxID=1314778 RepID=A0A5C3PM92_9APHY|nr:pirin domain-containing protein [Polyporus arcularius HHB13444]
MKFVSRPSSERGNADHGWLKTFHTFSFASYYDAQHDHYGCLRVINEDRVEPKTGFGTHAHREFEIFSYIVSGELEHRDSMGNVEVMKRGDLQMTSAGTGIRHSEHTHGAQQVHFLQIWSVPSTRGLSPQYFTRHFSDDEKRDRWAHVVAPVEAEGVVEKREAPGPAPVHSPLDLYATLLSQGKKLSHVFGRQKGYIHVVQTSGYNTKEASGAHVRVSGTDGGPVDLKEGDGAYISAAPGEELVVENVGDRVAEILLFDLE